MSSNVSAAKKKYSDTRNTMVTIPARAANSSECFIPVDITRQILALKGFPVALEKPNAPAFQIVDIPNKGRGMIAARDLDTGDLILDERPLIVEPHQLSIEVPKGYTPNNLTHQEVENLRARASENMLRAAYDRMPKQNQELFMALHDCQGIASCNSFPLAGRANTNGFSIGSLVSNGEGVQGRLPDHDYFSGIWATISYCNHSCSPNSLAKWSTLSFSFQLRAAHPVAAGAEITISYTGDLFKSHIARQLDLASYAFQCACPACTEPVKSDANRRKLEAICNAENGKKGNTDLQNILTALRLIEVEVLWAHEVCMFLYHEAVRGYVMLGDLLAARKYATKLVAAARIHRQNTAVYERYTREHVLRNMPFFGVKRKMQSSLKGVDGGLSLD